MVAAHRFLRFVSPLAMPVALLALGACSGGGSSPTGPGITTVHGASITGDVSSGGAPAAGVEVSVDGRAGSVATDAGGRFELAGVAQGDRVLSFDTGSASSSLVLSAVRPDERIEISVALSGSQAQLRSIRRTAPGAGDLVLTFSPDAWNPNWNGSSGQLQAFVRGAGFDSIDPGSVLLYGDDPTLAPLAPRRSAIEGDHLKATFGKSAALALLPSPQSGEMRVLRLDFLLDGVPTSLTASITIVPGGGPGIGQLRLSIQPDSWNLNWSGSAGTVSAKISGTGFDQIDPASIQLVGTDPAALPLLPVRSERNGNHVRAFFAKPAALVTLDTPMPGESHVVTVEFLLAGTPGSLSDTVRIVGN